MTHARSGFASWGFTLLFLVPLVASSDTTASEHAYVGAQKCKMCHNSAAKGAQFTQWSKSRHALAYQTLAGDEAKKIAAAKGIADPQKEDECLKCHVTGHGAPADKLTAKYTVEDGVGCESCHGAGSEYQKMKIMKSREQSLAAGLVIPNEQGCITCHNSESPVFKGFDFKAYFEKISHPNPKKAAQK